MPYLLYCLRDIQYKENDLNIIYLYKQIKYMLNDEKCYIHHELCINCEFNSELRLNAEFTLRQAVK